MLYLSISIYMSPQDFFSKYDATQVSEWGKFARYHDVHVTNSDYVITYLDPTIYTAWCLYNTNDNLPVDYVTKLASWNYSVCYFTSEVAHSEALRQPITLGLSSDLFPDTPFTHRQLL